MGEGEVADCVFGQNGLSGRLSEAEFKASFKLCFRTGPKDRNTVHWVVEVSPQLRKDLRQKGRLYLCFSSVKVDDYIAVSRCHKCQGFGHKMAKCRRTDTLCTRCSEKDHVVSDCKAAKPVCANCRFAKLDSDHAVDSKDCPCYKAALRRELESYEV